MHLHSNMHLQKLPYYLLLISFKILQLIVAKSDTAIWPGPLKSLGNSDGMV